MYKKLIQYKALNIFLLVFLASSLVSGVIVVTNKEIAFNIRKSYACDSDGYNSRGVCTKFTTTDSKGNKTTWTSSNDGTTTATKGDKKWKLDKNGNYVKGSLQTASDDKSSNSSSTSTSGSSAGSVTSCGGGVSTSTCFCTQSTCYYNSNGKTQEKPIAELYKITALVESNLVEISGNQIKISGSTDTLTSVEIDSLYVYMQQLQSKKSSGSYDTSKQITDSSTSNEAIKAIENTTTLSEPTGALERCGEGVSTAACFCTTTNCYWNDSNGQTHPVSVINKTILETVLSESEVIENYAQLSIKLSDESVSPLTEEVLVDRYNQILEEKAKALRRVTTESQAEYHACLKDGGSDCESIPHVEAERIIEIENWLNYSQTANAKSEDLIAEEAAVGMGDFKVYEEQLAANQTTGIKDQDLIWTPTERHGNPGGGGRAPGYTFQDLKTEQSLSDLEKLSNVAKAVTLLGGTVAAMLAAPAILPILVTNIGGTILGTKAFISAGFASGITSGLSATLLASGVLFQNEIISLSQNILNPATQALININFDYKINQLGMDENKALVYTFTDIASAQVISKGLNVGLSAVAETNSGFGNVFIRGVDLLDNTDDSWTFIQCIRGDSSACSETAINFSIGPADTFEIPNSIASMALGKIGISVPSFTAPGTVTINNYNIELGNTTTTNTATTTNTDNTITTDRNNANLVDTASVYNALGLDRNLTSDQKAEVEEIANLLPDTNIEDIALYVKLSEYESSKPSNYTQTNLADISTINEKQSVPQAEIESVPVIKEEVESFKNNTDTQEGSPTLAKTVIETATDIVQQAYKTVINIQNSLSEIVASLSPTTTETTTNNEEGSGTEKVATTTEVAEDETTTAETDEAEVTTAETIDEENTSNKTQETKDLADTSSSQEETTADTKQETTQQETEETTAQEQTGQNTTSENKEQENVQQTTPAKTLAERVNNLRNSLLTTINNVVNNIRNNTSNSNVADTTSNTAKNQTGNNLSRSEKNSFTKAKKDTNQPEITQKLLADQRFFPTKKVETNNKTFYLSDGVKLNNGKGYSQAVMYFKNDQGEYLARALFKSNSSGSWRVAPYLIGGAVYSKGLFHYTQETRLSQDIVIILEKTDISNNYDGDIVKDFFSSSTNMEDSITNYSNEIKKFNDNGLLGQFQKYQPGTYTTTSSQSSSPTANIFSNFTYPDGFIPDFSSGPIKTEETSHSLLGNVTLKTYEGTLNSQPVSWVMAYGSNGRVWIDQIYLTNAEINSYGIRSEVIDSGALTNKPLEYFYQSDNLDKSDYVEYDGKYNDITPLLSNLKPIQEFKKYMDLDTSKSTSQTQQTIQPLTNSISQQIKTTTATVAKTASAATTKISNAINTTASKTFAQNIKAQLGKIKSTLVKTVLFTVVLTTTWTAFSLAKTPLLSPISLYITSAINNSAPTVAVEQSLSTDLVTKENLDQVILDNMDPNDVQKYSWKASSKSTSNGFEYGLYKSEQDYGVQMFISNNISRDLENPLLVTDINRAFELLPGNILDETFTDLNLPYRVLVSDINGSGGYTYGTGEVVLYLNPYDYHVPYGQNQDIVQDANTATLLHEMIHSLGTPQVISEFVDASKTDGIYFSTRDDSHVDPNSIAGNDFLSYNLYPTSQTEGFALSGVAYILAPDSLKTEQPTVYDFYKNRVFGGIEYQELVNAGGIHYIAPTTTIRESSITPITSLDTTSTSDSDFAPDVYEEKSYIIPPPDTTIKSEYIIDGRYIRDKDATLSEIALTVFAEASNGTDPDWAQELLAWSVINRAASTEVAEYYTGALGALISSFTGGSSNASTIDAQTQQIINYYQYESGSSQGERYKNTLRIVQETYLKYLNGEVDPTHGALYFSKQNKLVRDGISFSSAEELQTWLEENSENYQEGNSSFEFLVTEPFTQNYWKSSTDEVYQGNDVILYFGTDQCVSTGACRGTSSSSQSSILNSVTETLSDIWKQMSMSSENIKGTSQGIMGSSLFTLINLQVAQDWLYSFGTNKAKKTATLLMEEFFGDNISYFTEEDKNQNYSFIPNTAGIITNLWGGVKNWVKAINTSNNSEGGYKKLAEYVQSGEKTSQGSSTSLLGSGPAQIFENWSQKYIYYKYPEAATSGTTPKMLWEGFTNWTRDITTSIPLNIAEAVQIATAQQATPTTFISFVSQIGTTNYINQSLKYFGATMQANYNVKRSTEEALESFAPEEVSQKSKVEKALKEYKTILEKYEFKFQFGNSQDSKLQYIISDISGYPDSALLLKPYIGFTISDNVQLEDLSEITTYFSDTLTVLNFATKQTQKDIIGNYFFSTISNDYNLIKTIQNKVVFDSEKITSSTKNNIHSAEFQRLKEIAIRFSPEVLLSQISDPSVKEYWEALLTDKNTQFILQKENGYQFFIENIYGVETADIPNKICLALINSGNNEAAYWYALNVLSSTYSSSGQLSDLDALRDFNNDILPLAFEKNPLLFKIYIENNKSSFKTHIGDNPYNLFSLAKDNPALFKQIFELVFGSDNAILNAVSYVENNSQSKSLIYLKNKITEESITLIENAFRSNNGILSLLDYAPEQDWSNLIRLKEIILPEVKDVLAIASSETTTPIQLQEARKNILDRIESARQSYKSFKNEIANGYQPSTETDFKMLDLYLQEISRDYYTEDLKGLAMKFNIDYSSLSSRWKVLQDVNGKLETVPLTPVSYSFDLQTQAIEKAIPEGLASLLKGALSNLTVSNKTIQAETLDKIKNNNSSTIIQNLISTDSETQNEALETFLSSITDDNQRSTVNNKINGVLKAKLSTEQKITALAGIIGASKQLSVDEQSSLFSELFSRANMTDLVQKFLTDSLTSEELNLFITKLDELQTNYLPDFAIESDLGETRKTLEATNLWKTIVQINKSTLEQTQAVSKYTKEISLVLADRTLLDVWQGVISGTCFGNYPAHLSQRKNIVPVKMVKDGEVFGNALFIIQENRFILIGFDPSESFTSGINNETLQNFVDKSMSGLAQIAKENNWELMIGVPDEVGGLSNRRGIQNIILNNYFGGSTEVAIQKEEKLQPAYGYVPENAYKLDPVIINQLENNATGKTNIINKPKESSSKLIGASIIPGLNAQIFENWSQKYIYSRYPKAATNGTTPKMLWEGVRESVNDITTSIKKIINKIPPGTSSIKIDVGGGNAPDYYSFGTDFITVNINPVAEPNVVADANNLPFANKSINIYCSSCLPMELLSKPEFFTEASRVLNSGGTIIYKGTSFQTKKSMIINIFSHSITDSISLIPVVTPEYLITELDNAGFINTQSLDLGGDSFFDDYNTPVKEIMVHGDK